MVREVSEDHIYDTIEFNEFLQMMSKQQSHSMTEDSLKEAFRIFDKDDDGFISVEELRNIMQNLGEKMTDKELDEMIAEADSDRDGLINYQEFVQVLCSESTSSKSSKGKKLHKKKCKDQRKSRGDSKTDLKDNDKEIAHRPHIEEVVIEHTPKSQQLTAADDSQTIVGAVGVAKALVNNVAATALLPLNHKPNASPPRTCAPSSKTKQPPPNVPPAPVTKPGFKGSVSASSINNNHNHATNINAVAEGMGSILGDKVDVVDVKSSSVNINSHGLNNNQQQALSAKSLTDSTSSMHRKIVAK